uniref:Uncharacterized protein n=1 Tax=Globisporangium ultimum (strain ATCC 200006 / CBS 805.95 / DAOM BR144) TaxID=431595 RepID=K3WGZ3_GLOUD
ALATYHNDLDALRCCFDPSLNALQISRATYLDICMHEQVQVDAITDSLEHEEKQNALMDEKMEFFAAVEQGKLTLGDTLLHIAVRLGHEAIVDFLLLTDHVRSPGARTPESALRPPTAPQPPSTPAFSGSSQSAPALNASSAPLNTTQTPNFKGELPKDVVGNNLFIKLLLETVFDVHDVFGVAYKGEPKVHRMVGCLRRIWPLWMFEGQQEVASLVRVIYDTRSSDPAFGNLVKVVIAVSERFRSIVSSDGVRLATRLLRKHDGDIQAARHTLTSEWTSEQKRQLLFEIFKRWFRTWKWRRHDERDTAYVQFFDAAMGAWLQLAQDLQLHRVGDSTSATSNEYIDTRVDAAVLKRYELQIWKRRMHPPFTYMEDLCTHLTALESHLELAHLKT